MPLDVDSVMSELEALGTERTKKSYLSRGVREPLFGVPTGAMKPLKRRIGVDQALADVLWGTGNYDAMYLAGMIADVRVMSEADFDRWMEGAYCPMLADFVVAATLAESELAQSVANRWIRSDDENRAAAGWACYEWLLGWRPDGYFEVQAVRELLDIVTRTIHAASEHEKRAMSGFLVAVGVSYLPLHQEALKAADAIGPVDLASRGAAKTPSSAAEQIRKATEKGRIGFKRRAVRC